MSIENEDEDDFEMDFECEDDFCESEKPKKSKSKKTVQTHLDKISNLFDEVFVDESHDDYYLFVCQDKAQNNKGNIEKVVWLQVKISKHELKNSHRGLIDHVESIVKDIIDLKVNLFGKEESNSFQTSLFGDEKVEEPEPDREQFQKWLKWEKKKNLKRISELPFLEGFNFRPRGLYLENDFSRFLPTNDELISIIKDGITRMKDNPRREDSFWFSNERGYISKDTPMSDCELQGRIGCTVRVFLLPYTYYKHFSYDLSYSLWEYEDSTNYRCYFDYGKINFSDNLKYENLPEYDIFTTDLTQYVRELFQIPICEVVKDLEVLDYAAMQSYESMFSEIQSHYKLHELDSVLNRDIKKNVEKHKDWVSLKAETIKGLKDTSHNGGSGGSYIDGYSVDIERHKTKPEIKITQVIKDRINQGKCTDFPIDWSKYVVFHIKGDDVFKAIYDAYTRDSKKSMPIQTTLFDFLAA